MTFFGIEFPSRSVPSETAIRFRQRRTLQTRLRTYRKMIDETETGG